jgi:hypothetical protein
MSLGKIQSAIFGTMAGSDMHATIPQTGQSTPLLSYTGLNAAIYTQFK